MAAFEPGLEQLENSLFEQAAAQGQTVFEWAGDDGSDSCAYHGSSPVAPVLSSNDPAANPWVLAVGGTTIADATTPPTEQVWNDGATGGAGGGGISAVWSAPSWQSDGLVRGFDDPRVVAAAEKLDVPSCSSAPCRETPDVTAQADEYTGAITVYETQYGGWTTFGGTSSSTPLWAAMLADVASTSACTASGPLGFVNPKLYAIAAVPSEDTTSFNDITVGNTDVFGDTGGLFPATVGYDMASGLGSPRMTNPDGTPGLASYLCSTPGAAVPAVRSVTPVAVPAAGGGVTVHGAGFESGTTPDVVGVQVGTVALAPSSYAVRGPTTLAVTLPPADAQRGTGGATDGDGSYTVTVTLGDGQTSAPSAAARVTYYATSGDGGLPEVDGIDSSGGGDAGGITVNVYGTGFESATTPTVTFGGVAGTEVSVVSDSLLTVEVPAYSPATRCATNRDPATDVCQTEVQVTTAAGASAESTIEPEFTGPAADEYDPGTGEVAPAATEFDYLAAPTISSVNVQGGAASEAGGSVATLTGTGFGALGLDWVDVGPYTSDDSPDYSFTYLSPTKLVVLLPAEAPTTTTLAEPVYVQSGAAPTPRTCWPRRRATRWTWTTRRPPRSPR